MSKEVIILNSVSKKFVIPSKKEKGPTALIKSFLKKYKFSALNKINLTIKKGECIGLIGKNGTGKTLLLKIIAGIVCPTSGNVRVQEPVYPILERELLFYPELSGRDNIFFCSSLLGIKQKEVKERFDEIVTMSDLNDFLDLKVQYYSSGMRTRLDLSIASLLNPSIILLDEVFSFSDQSFAKKIYEKIDEWRDNKVTMLITSHSFELLSRFCTTGIVLHKGEIMYKGEINNAIDYYRKNILCESNN